MCYLLDWKPFKNDRKCFLFNLKNSFCSQDICFCYNFWSCRRNGLIRMIWLTSKFMTPQPGLQAIAIHILPNISQSKGNQTIEFGQMIEDNKRNSFLQKLCGKWGRETNSRPLFIFRKSLKWGESRWSAVWFCYISINVNLIYNKSKLNKTLEYWSRVMSNFNFSEKSLGLVSPPHFVHDFSRKVFPILHSINWTNFIVWLLLLLGMLGNMCIRSLC